MGRAAGSNSEGNPGSDTVAIERAEHRFRRLPLGPAALPQGGVGLGSARNPRLCSAGVGFGRGESPAFRFARTARLSRREPFPC